MLICLCNIIGVTVGSLTLCSGMGILAHLSNTTLDNMATPTGMNMCYLQSGLFPS